VTGDLAAAPVPTTGTDAPVLVRDEGHVRVVTLNRPEARNAIDLATALAVETAMDEYEERDDLWAAVLTANGSAFCAGMDLKAFLRGERPYGRHRGFAGIVEKPPTKPLIAAVDGPAVAGGFEIALCCDLIVTSTESRFALPEVKRGLVAGGGGLMRLPRRIPFHRAVELSLTGRVLPATEAYDLGLVSKLVDPGAVLDAAMGLAGEIIANAPLAVQATKQILYGSADWPAEETFDRQRGFSEPVRESADAREGASAFVERRDPRWQRR
jgi:enoyl-CoA hydratase